MMKFILLFAAIFFTIPILTYSQDTIIKKNGLVFPCRIYKEDSAEISFIFKKNGKEINAFIIKNEILEVKYGKPSSTLPIDLSIKKNNVFFRCPLGRFLAFIR